MFDRMTRGIVTLCCLVATASATVSAQVQTIQISGSQVGHETLKAVKLGEHVRIVNMRIPNGVVDLELDRVTVLTPNALLRVGTKDGIIELARPDVIVLSGIVAGDADSMAYIAVSPYGTNGFIEIANELISISTGPYAQEKDLRDALKAAWMSEVTDPENAPSLCGYTNGDAALEPSGRMIEVAPNPNRGGTTCRIAGIAVETDWEFTDRLFSGNTNASAAYLVSLVGAISEIYERDMNVRLAIPFLRVWGDNSDPYSSAGDPLDQVLGEWNANMSHVDRTLTHYFTGRQDTSYGGVAYLSVLCNTDFGYGVSAYLNGSFPYPLVDHNGGNWDVVVASHELGHNFGTSHTHNYSPQIDGCGTGDCSEAFGGTIMSYCHSCSGGLTNIVLGFHPRVQDTIIAYMDSINCDLIGEGVSAVPDSAETLQDEPIQIDALGNDESQSCDSFVLDSFDTVSTGGGTIEQLAGQGPGGRDLFMYSPISEFEGVDTFQYAIVGAGSPQVARVSINVRALRPADDRLDPLSGLRVRYYELPNNTSVLPDFDTLESYNEDVSSDVNYPSTGGVFMSSDRADNVGAVLSGYVLAINDGIFTFTTESDDGSKLFIGDELVVDNDGLHGMVKRGGSIPLSVGWHRIRIEFFERGGGAGLISTITGPGFPEMNLEEILLSHETNEPCSLADINADGNLNFFDISAFIELLNAQDPAADFTNDGNWNFFDVAVFLGAFAEGCP